MALSAVFTAAFVLPFVGGVIVDAATAAGSVLVSAHPL
jgi:NADH-quinone oxidoreductase subunit N